MKEKYAVILVTGGSGFIGTNFIRFWIRNHQRCKVINLDKLTYAGTPNNLKDIELSANYQFIKGDICDFDLVSRIVENLKPDCIINFAAETHVDRSLDDPRVFVQTNISGTHNLLEISLKHKIKRFHQVSTLNFSEKGEKDEVLLSSNPYMASKVAADHLVSSFHRSFGLPITITKCSNNYGPYQHPEKFIPRMITNLIENKKILIYDKGREIRDWLYVEDNCRAIEAVLINGIVGDSYHVGSAARDINNLELAKMILGTMNKTEAWIEFIPGRPEHDYKYIIDWTKIHHELGWSPSCELGEMLEQTVRWYQDNETWWRPLKKEADRLYVKLNKDRQSQ